MLYYISIKSDLIQTLLTMPVVSGLMSLSVLPVPLGYVLSPFFCLFLSQIYYFYVLMSNLFFINIEISSRIHFKVLGSLYMINLSSKYTKPLRIHSRALKHHLLI